MEIQFDVNFLTRSTRIYYFPGADDGIGKFRCEIKFRNFLELMG